jgi:hypothetical protein
VADDPDQVRLLEYPLADHLRLTYGDTQMIATVTLQHENLAEIYAAVEEPGAAREVCFQISLQLHPGATLRALTGEVRVLGEAALELTAAALGGGLRSGRWTLHLPPGATFRWPVRPFNSYRQDNRSPLSDAGGLIAVPVPLNGDRVAVGVLVEAE